MISHDQLVKAIQDNCPDLHAKQLEPLGEGDFCHAYTVNERWVVRFAKHMEAAQSLQREACLLPKIRNQLDLIIPEPHYYEDTNGTELAFVTYPKLSGIALTQLQFLSLPHKARNTCAAQIAQFVTQLHTCDRRFADGCGVPRCEYRVQYMEILRRAENILLPLLEAHEKHYVETTLTEYLNDTSSIVFEPVLLHGDLSPDHVLYDPQNMHVTGVIDFGDMMVGDPAWDLTYLYEDYGVDFLRYFLKHYGVNEQREEVARAYRFHELDAIDWTVSAVEKEHGSEAQEGIMQLKRLRLQSKAPPWIELFE